MKIDVRFYLTLFKTTFYLSAFTFGGGYVIVPLMKKKFVEELEWIEEREMLDFVAIGQSAPGVMAVNTSILVGYRLAGMPGALISTLGTVLPPLITISILSIVYKTFQENILARYLLKGLQAGVAAIILDVTITMIVNVFRKKEIVSDLILVVSFILAFFLKANLILLILLFGISGALASVLYRNK
ncbi:chromate transporter [Parasporobacterium paucivorans]|uniref:Chromate transporter n=1 Tax=Parasporobacterium paucivorans DSM 15970 TaxID=1122934 RepID=A0A1M6D4Z5_9FIRM|nr:chromate transporter [Parasporobacterium paucivorans]SHI68144.1 chromate transporter [Parasporobacterium paucivorans DSM 15970]